MLKQTKHAQVKPHKAILLKRRIGAGALSVLLASSLAIPAFAAESVTFTGDDGQTYSEAASGEGWSWDGGDNFAMNNYSGPGYYAEGNLNVDASGTNTVNGNIAASGDLTITGDSNAAGDNKPSITLTNEDKSDGGGNSVYGKNVSVSDVQIKFDNDGYGDEYYYGSLRGSGTWNSEAEEYEGGNLTVKDSKVVATNPDAMQYKESSYSNQVRLSANGTLDLVGSVIDLGAIYSNGQMTIDNSDVTSKDIWYEADAGGDYPNYSISSNTGITLKGMKNGTVKEYKDPETGETIFYYIEETGEGITELKASETPAYYGKTKGAASTMPQTGDTVAGPAALAAAAAAALGGLATVGLRKRGKHENL